VDGIGQPEKFADITKLFSTSNQTPTTNVSAAQSAKGNERQ
jgi:hypothetical protein